MDPQERRHRYANTIRMTLSHENSLLRHITFTYPPTGDRQDIGRIEVTIDGQEAGRLFLGVRAASLSPDQEQKLKDKGFVSETDDDDPRFALYTAEAPSASIDDLVTFVEWVHLAVLGAPSDYEARVETISSRGQAQSEQAGRGCFKSCTSVAGVAFWIILGIIVLTILFRWRH